MRTEASRTGKTDPTSASETGETESPTQEVNAQDAPAAAVARDDGQSTDAEILALESTLPAQSVAAPPSRFLVLQKRVQVLLQSISLDERVGRIILSVVLASLLWFYVTSLENPAQVTQFNGLTLEVRNLGSSLKVINSLPQVNVTVQAPQNLLGTLRQTDVRPYVDLQQLDAGVHQVPVIIDDTDIADHASMNFSVYPSSVQVQLEVEATRVFSVAVRVVGTPAQNYGAEPAQVNPSQIQITGPENAINHIAQVVVVFDVDGTTSTQSAYKSPTAVDSAGQEINGLTYQPTTVQVVVPIKSLITTKPVPVHVPIVGNPAPGYSASEINLNPTNLIICCAPNNILTSISSIDTNPVSISGTTSTVVTTTEVILPPGVQLYPGQSSTISVTVEIATFQTSWQLSAPLTVQNAAPNTTAVLSPSSVNLTLSGTLAQFQSLKPSDITATVDASGLGPGTYNIAPQVTVPQGIALVDVNPAKVSLSLIPPTPVPPTPAPTEAPTSTVPAIVPATATPPPSPTPLPSSTPTSPPTPIPTVSPTATATGTPSPTSLAPTATPSHTPTATPPAPTATTTPQEGTTSAGATAVVPPTLEPNSPAPTGTPAP